MDTVRDRAYRRGVTMLRKTRQGDVLRTMACPVPPAEQNKLRGARRALIATQPAGPVTIWRRVSQRGSVMVARQKSTSA